MQYTLIGLCILGNCCDSRRYAIIPLGSNKVNTFSHLKENVEKSWCILFTQYIKSQNIQYDYFR